MILTCNTQELKKCIQTALRAISSKPSTPIFSGLHFIAEGNTLEIQGMDLNLAIASQMEAQVVEPGAIVISAKLLAEVARNLTGANTTITQMQNRIKITSDNYDPEMLLMDEEDYPVFPAFEAATVVAISEANILDLIKKTSFACSTEENRPLFTGVLAEVKEDEITFVGTNTHRLAVKKLAQNNAETITTIIPAKLLNEIQYNLGGEIPAEVIFKINQNQVEIDIDKVRIISRLIEGRFPDYRKVVPAQANIKTTVDAKQLALAVKRVSIFSNEGDYSVIRFDVKENNIIVTSSSPDLGNGRDVVPCQTEGGTLKVAFNAKYIMDLLQNTNANEIQLNMNTSLSPVCITTAEDPDYKYVVTPVRVVF